MDILQLLESKRKEYEAARDQHLAQAQASQAAHDQHVQLANANNGALLAIDDIIAKVKAETPTTE